MNRLVMVALIVLAVALLSCGILAVAVTWEGKRYANVEKIGSDIASIADTPADTPAPSEEEPTGPEVMDLVSNDPMDRALNWDGIWEINKDAKSWIYIPDTPIDYAILDEPYDFDNGEYFYLRHDIYGKSSDSGWIFSIMAPDGAEDMHRLVFGHNMGSKSTIMFGTLHEYKEKSFQESHPYIYVYYKDRAERWAVWTAMNVKGDDNVYVMPYVRGSKEYADLIQSLSDRRGYDSGVMPPTDSQNMMTLSTCDRGFGGQQGRFIVNAVLDQVKYASGDVYTAEEYYKKISRQF